MYALLYGYRNDEEEDWQTTLLGVYRSETEAEAMWEVFKKDLSGIFQHAPTQDLVTHHVMKLAVGENLWDPKPHGTVRLHADLGSRTFLLLFT